MKTQTRQQTLTVTQLTLAATEAAGSASRLCRVVGGRQQRQQAPGSVTQSVSQCGSATDALFVMASRRSVTNMLRISAVTTSTHTHTYTQSARERESVSERERESVATAAV